MRNLLPKFFKQFLKKMYSNQFRFGFTPFDLISLSPVIKYSSSSKVWNAEYDRGWGGWIPANNHSHGYHGLLSQWWSDYGLGANCLLISETIEVANDFSKLYTSTNFISTDYYIDLVDEGKTHVLWNLYDTIPKELKEGSFNSVISQATMEHLMDPVGVVRKLKDLLIEGGFIYLHTHTPLYPYHGWPRDYVRYFPDWFRDLPQILKELELVELYCKEGHVFAAYKKVAINQ
jgi:hypothetical protein